MPIRFVKADDYDRLQYIATYCFPWMHEFTDRIAENLKKYVAPQNVLGYYDETETLMAALQVLPFNIMVGGNAVGMGGIAMVSSMPEGRHGGRIAALLERSLQVMRDRGQFVSMLGPFSYEFYRKYGWELGFERLNYTIPIEHLKSFKKKIGSIRPVTEADIPVLDKLYMAYAGKHNGCVVRDEMIWKNFILNDLNGDKYNRYAYLWSYDSGVPGGYIIYTIKDRKMNIFEMMYEDQQAKEGLLWFIYAHQAQIGEVAWSTAADERLHVMLPNPRVDMKLTTGMMFRVVDVREAVAHRGYSAELNAHFTVQIDDHYAPWNCQTFSMRFLNGSAVVEECAESSLYCNIQTFSQIFIGFLTPYEAAEMGWLKGDTSAIDAMAKAFPKSATFNNNAF